MVSSPPDLCKTTTPGVLFKACGRGRRHRASEAASPPPEPDQPRDGARRGRGARDGRQSPTRVDNRRLGSAALAAAGLLLAAAAPARAWDPAERVSVGPHGRQANGASGGRVTMSPDGRYVVFVSDATNLVPRDTNGLADLFVRDRKLGTIERVNLGPKGVQGNDIIVSYGPAISDNGRYVAFVSDATNLVDGDNNGAGDVFVRDRWKGRTERVSVAGDGTQGNDFSGYGVAISGDGRYVAFGSLA